MVATWGPEQCYMEGRHTVGGGKKNINEARRGMSRSEAKKKTERKSGTQRTAAAGVGAPCKSRKGAFWERANGRGGGQGEKLEHDRQSWKRRVGETVRERNTDGL